MRFLELNISNFMSFGSIQHVNLKDAGLTLIEGENRDDESASSNGAAKSAIIDALLWCLYGITAHEPSAEGDEVINRFVEDASCSVTLLFEHAGKACSIVRMRGKQNRLVFTVNEEELSKSSVRETQKAVERFLGMSAVTFRHSVIFGQSRAYRFARLSDADKKAVIDEMLGSEVYTRAATLAGEHLRTVERELEVTKISLGAASESLQESRKQLVELEAKEASAEADKAARVAKAEKRLKELEDEPVAKPDPADDVDARHNKRLDQFDVAKKKAVAAGRQVSIGQAEVARVQREVVKLLHRADDIDGSVGKQCDACLQPVKAEHTKAIAQKLRNEAKTEKAKLRDVLEPQLADHQKYAEKAEEELAKAKDALDKAHRECDRKDDLHAEWKRYKTVLKRAKDDVEEAKREESHFATLIAQMKGQVARHLVAVTGYEEQIEKLKQDHAELSFWREGFSAKGLRSLMLDSVLPYLNGKLRKYSEALTAGNIAVELRATRELKSGGTKEEFHVHVDNKHGASSYKMLSIGERTKVDIVVGLALQDMAASRSRVPVNIAFFDEVFDGLDATGVDIAVQVLSQLKRESAFVITHNDSLKTYFHNSLRVVKENNISRIE